MQCPVQKAPVHNLWATCGRREREAGTGNEEERSSPVLSPRRWKASWSVSSASAFAGWRKNTGLGRFVSTCVTGLIPHVRRTDDSGCPLEERGGERRQRTQSARTRLRRARQKRDPRSSRTRPSLDSRDPCTSIATELFSVKSRSRWRDRFGIAVGQTWATRKNRHRGRIGRTNARLASCHRLARGGRDAKEKEEDHGPRPCKEKREPRFGCPYVGMQLQKSSGGVGSQIPTHAALPKEWRCE